MNAWKSQWTGNKKSTVHAISIKLDIVIIFNIFIVVVVVVLLVNHRLSYTMWAIYTYMGNGNACVYRREEDQLYLLKVN